MRTCYFSASLPFISTWHCNSYFSFHFPFLGKFYRRCTILALSGHLYVMTTCHNFLFSGCTSISTRTYMRQKNNENWRSSFSLSCPGLPLPFLISLLFLRTHIFLPCLLNIPNYLRRSQFRNCFHFKLSRLVEVFFASFTGYSCACRCSRRD